MWFYSQANERIGPVPLDALVEEMVAGRVKDHDLLWTEGLPNWVPASEVLEVQKAVADARMSLAAPGWTPQPRMAQAPQMNTMALTSMILGICSIVMGTMILTGLPAVICGHIARRQIRESPHTTGGDGMALAGLILGYLSILMTLAVVGILVFLFLGVAAAAGGMP